MMQNTITTRYMAEEKLGQGGMGVVYRAHDRLTGQKVALKQVHTPLRQLSFQSKTDQDEYRLALTREFQTLASLRHPHIISVLDYGFSAEQQPYFTMTLIDTPQSLREFALQKTVVEKIHLIIQILQAVAYLHQRGILHRDLKPGNILVAEGQIKVLDFGLAIEHSTERSTAGTIAYMAPEVLMQGRISEASDLYAVGVIAYELLVGTYPFALVNHQPVITDILTQLPDLSPLQSLQNELLNVTSPSSDIDEQTHLLHSEKTTEPAHEPTTISALEESDTDTAPAFPVDVATTQTGSPDVDLSSDATVHLASHPIQSKLTPRLTPRQNVNLASIVDKLLAKTPEERYQKANEVIRDLYQVIGQSIPPESADIRESFLQAAKFVGRDDELKTLQTALHEAIQGRGSIWLVGGESGVGKSRLVSELRTYALVSGVLVVRGQGIANGGLAFQLWRDVLPRLVLGIDLSDLEAGILKELVPNMDDLLGRAIPDAPELTGKEGQQRLVLTIQSVLQRQPQPVLLLLEDLQWAEESLAPVRQITHHIEHLPLLIVGNYRHDERPDLPNELPNTNLLLLQRLTNEAIAQLSASMLGEVGLNADILNLMTHETEGNTFFMVEVARALAEEAGTLTAIGNIHLPEHVFTGGMASLLQRRLGQIAPEYRPLLAYAAVTGRQLDLTLLKHLLPETDVETWLYQGQSVAVLEVQDNTWQFTHDKLREAVLHELDNLSDLHQQVAEAIETLYDAKDYAEVLMHHWQAAKNTEKELDYLMLVAEEMVNYSARYKQANALLQYGMTLSNELPSSVYYLLGMSEERTGNYSQATDYYQHCLTKILSSDVLSQVDTLNRLSANEAWQSNYAKATQYGKQALSLAQQVSYSKGIAHALNRLGSNLANSQGDYDQAVAYYEEALSLQRNIGDVQGMSSSLVNLAGIKRRQGFYDNATYYYEKALEIDRIIGDRWGIAISLNGLGSIAGIQGNLEKAKIYFEEALTIDRQIGDQWGVAIALSNLGVVAENTGDYSKAQEYYEQSLAIKRSIGDQKGIATSLNNLGVLAIDRGDYDRAKLYFEEALSINRILGEEWGVMISLQNLNAIRLRQHDITVKLPIQDLLKVALRLKSSEYILHGLVLVSWWQLNQSNIQGALEWLSMVFNNPACVPEIKKDAQPVLDQLQVLLSAEELETGMERGKQMTMEEAIARVFAELEDASS